MPIVRADICVLGAGISGVTAALEAAKLGRKVVIVDGAPALGGQAIGSIIGTLIGLYTHGPNAYQITHGVADDLLRDLDAEGSLLRMHRSTVTFQYDEVRLGRWMERKIEEAGVQRHRRCRAHGCGVRESPREARRVRHTLRRRARAKRTDTSTPPVMRASATKPASMCASRMRRSSAP